MMLVFLSLTQDEDLKKDLIDFNKFFLLFLNRIKTKKVLYMKQRISFGKSRISDALEAVVAIIITLPILAIIISIISLFYPYFSYYLSFLNLPFDMSNFKENSVNAIMGTTLFLFLFWKLILLPLAITGYLTNPFLDPDSSNRILNEIPLYKKIKRELYTIMIFILSVAFVYSTVITTLFSTDLFVYFDVEITLLNKIYIFAIGIGSACLLYYFKMRTYDLNKIFLVRRKGDKKVLRRNILIGTYLMFFILGFLSLSYYFIANIFLMFLAIEILSHTTAVTYDFKIGMLDGLPPDY